MTNIKRTSITDTPRDVKNNDKDRFGIEPFEKGLIRFISNTSTPITIALQGEWGSGKTSLMNSLEQSLCDKNDGEYFSIWLNTWEYSLMKNANETLVEIIMGLLKESISIAETYSSKTDLIKVKTKRILEIAGKLTLKFAGNYIADGLGSDISDKLNSDSKSTIGEIRDELEYIILDTVQKSGKKGVVFFIDDLDRIDPPVAVELLELLKNIFTLDKCVFVLAIDYDVVIKGLEPKFGKLDDKNEREFRSFFDKIIQVPFSMPVSNYKVDDFLRENLSEIDYIDEILAKDDKVIKEFANFTKLTVGTNPRALKRLLNSLSLIDCINIENSKHEENVDENLDNEYIKEKLLNFALVSIQIAYPQIYRLLSMHPGFNKWDESIALKLNLPVMDDQNIAKLTAMEEFDEVWELVLYRFCERDYHLKKNALNISVLLNSMRTLIIGDSDAQAASNQIEDTLTDMLAISAVTNLEAFDKPVINYHRGDFLKNIRSVIIDNMKKGLPEIKDLIAPQGKRVQSNAYIKFAEKDWEDYIQLHTDPYKGQVRLDFEAWAWFCYSESGKDLKQIVAEFSLSEELDNLITRYNNLISDYPQFNFKPVDEILYEKDGHRLYFHANIALPDVESFFIEPNITIISNMMIDWKRFWIAFYSISSDVINLQKANSVK